MLRVGSGKWKVGSAPELRKALEIEDENCMYCPLEPPMAVHVDPRHDWCIFIYVHVLLLEASDETVIPIQRNDLMPL